MKAIEDSEWRAQVEKMGGYSFRMEN
jgi:hypothetical protein